MTYECGTCGSRTLHLICKKMGEWQIRCGNGHLWVPWPGTELLIDPKPTS